MRALSKSLLEIYEVVEYDGISPHPEEWTVFQSIAEACTVEIKGFEDDDDSFHFAIEARLRSPSQKYVNLMAKALLMEHVKLQYENVQKCMKHEINNTFDGNIAKAIEVVHYRTFEAYSCWCEKHYLSHQDNRDRFAEILLYRVVQSISEHIFYCPERIAQVMHSILQTKNNTKDPCAPYLINAEYLHRGLDQVHACESDILNFDDINQCGAMDIKTLRKAWHESIGVAVLIDILRMYYPIFFMKAWLFSFAYWIREIMENKHYSESLHYWSRIIKIDSFAYLSVEVLLYLYSFWVQEHGQSWKRRSWQRLVGVILSLLGLTSLLFKIVPLDNAFAIISYIIFGRLFLFIFYLPIVERWLGRDRNFVKFGRPYWARQARKVTKYEREISSGFGYFNPRNSLSKSKSSKKTQSAIEYKYYRRADSNIHRSHLTFEEDDEYYDTATIFYSFCYCICTPYRKFSEINWQAVLFWLIVIGLTLFSEVQMVSPIFDGYTFINLCALSDPACPNMGSLTDIYWLSSKHRCIACGMGLISVYIMMALGSMINLYLVFNFVLAIFGFFKGLSRGVAGLLIAPSKFNKTLWRGEVTPLLPSSKSTVTLSNNRIAKIGPYLSKQLSVEEIKQLEKTPSGTRLSLIRLFGTWKNVLDVWGHICKSLHERDLISFTESQELRTCFDPPMENTREAKSLFGHKSKELAELLSGMSTEPRERILIFLKTIRVLGRQKDVAREFDQNGYDSQEFLEQCPSLSQIITTYNEDVMKTREFLRQKTGARSNLEHLISKHKKQWRLFEKRMIDEGIFKFNNYPTNQTSTLLDAFLECPDDLSFELIQEIRLWSSYRTQTVSRTIRGALVYHHALQVYIKWASENRRHQNNNVRKILKLDDMVELIISAQTYSSPNGHTRREDLDWLMERWKKYPIVIVFEFDKSRDNNNDYHPNDLHEINKCWQKHHATLFSNSPDDVKSQKQCEFPFDYATCVKKMVGEKLQIVNVLPRIWPLRLGRGMQKTQGKAANHLNASKKIWGHVTQVLDANMDGFIAEGFKLPFITHQLLSRINSGQKKAKSNRKNVRHRIIGFREYIFTAELGGVASIMASTESTFGTIYQRTLDDPLGVRMHYGHPDFFDTFWLLNRGGPSKASPSINLSEDIFAGFNVMLRNEDTLHVDTLEWQKGRETVFTSASMFLTKISKGMIGALRSRDMMDMHAGLSILTRFSLWCSTTGYWLSLVFISLSLYLFVLIFFLFSIAQVNDNMINLLDHTVSLQWMIAFGFSTSMPFLAEQLLERGLRGLWIWTKQWPKTTFFYIFQNQTIAASVIEGLQTGEASYINTGRPSFFSSYTKELAYRLYVKTHYYPALIVMWMYSYRLIDGNVGHHPSALLSVIIIVLFWLICPVIFCPNVIDIKAMSHDWYQTMKFLFSLKDDDTCEDSLYAFWKHNHRKEHDITSFAYRFTLIFIRFLKIGILILLSMEKNINPYLGYLLVLMIYLFFTVLWKITYKCNKIWSNIMWMASPLFVVIVLPHVINIQFSQDFKVVFIGAIGGDWNAQSLIRIVLFILVIRMVEDLCLLFFSIFCRLCLKREKLRSDDKNIRNAYIRILHIKIVDIFYLVGFHYHIHLYMAILVLSLQLVIHILAVIFGNIYVMCIKPIFAMRSSFQKSASIPKQLEYTKILTI